MEYSDGMLNEALPPGAPPLSMVPFAVRDEVAARYGDRAEEALVARSTYWTYAAISEFTLGNYYLSPDIDRFDQRGLIADGVRSADPLTSRLFVGLLDRKFEGFGFGFVLIAPFIDSASRQIGVAHFPRLQAQFPIAVRSMMIEPHLAHPAHATSACWADDNRRHNNWGVITAGHAVAGGRPGQPVNMTQGGRGSFVRSGYPVVDAAFIAAPSQAPRPSPSRRINVVSFPASGLAVDVKTQQQTQARNLVGVSIPYGVINTQIHGCTVALDTPCQPGDSGSFVCDGNGDGVGVYCGEMYGATVNGRTGQTIGYAQHFEQALLTLDVTAFT